MQSTTSIEFLSVTKRVEMVNENLQVVQEAKAKSEVNVKMKVATILKDNLPHAMSRSDPATSQLFNLEPGAEPEKPLNINLDLYQMEQDM
jgi:hypothetical protein